MSGDLERAIRRLNTTSWAVSGFDGIKEVSVWLINGSINDVIEHLEDCLGEELYYLDFKVKCSDGDLSERQFNTIISRMKEEYFELETGGY